MAVTIKILPAQLANQIAAGEVVERPASVVKELIENCLDAGATQINIDIEKGGAKKIRITDNGCGIVKQELALALSRHATSKIANLDDLEGIASLGFRGEALASISSVSRLTLTSKPTSQANAWQAMAQGRDMDVIIQPAAHPNGTSIEIVDLFFNTPARRKFLRTEKTEFTHIEEVLKRIALARFDVGFTLIHNGKLVKQYRPLLTASQHSKRLAQVCGAKFAEQALAVDCQHGDIQLQGWVVPPQFYRNQHDLCYSYVNGRMMRDKLINHAIRQAYADYIPDEGYPAFVLFLTLDVHEVDVNVHPAKHEVRFHQGRYVHDFIYTVVRDTILANANTVEVMPEQLADASLSATKVEYITPLQPLTKVASRVEQTGAINYSPAVTERVAEFANNDYQVIQGSAKSSAPELLVADYVTFVAPHFCLFNMDEQLHALSLVKLASQLALQRIKLHWSAGLVSQPLLLPIALSLTTEQWQCIEQHKQLWQQSGIVLQQHHNKVQIRQFPALLRAQDVSNAVLMLLKQLMAQSTEQGVTDQAWWQMLASISIPTTFDEKLACELFEQAQLLLKTEFKTYVNLNSVVLDLTSQLSRLT